MTTERRCIPRRRPGGISYFEFEAGSGGIVLDASEKGLAFQAADAVEQLGSRRILISPHPGERIELNADVVWMDGSKKAGGLRFIDPGADSCNRIRDWLSKQASQKSPTSAKNTRGPARQCKKCRIFLVAAPNRIRSHRYQSKSVGNGRSSRDGLRLSCRS